MKNRIGLALTGMFMAGFVASSAIAQVNEVDPFVGDQSEGFENDFSGYEVCAPDGVFSGTATLCTTNGSSLGFKKGWGLYCQVEERTGERSAGSLSGPVEYTFDTPVALFGGYFTSNSWDSWETPIATANFYDVDDNLIDSVEMLLGFCDWIWFGWETTGASFARIEIIGGNMGGAHVFMDDMEYTIEGSSSGCEMTLKVSELIAGESASWAVVGAEPNVEVAIVYGHNEGNTKLNGFADYCADFGIQGVSQKRLICRKTTDADGYVACHVNIPSNAGGARVLSQAAQRNTCPDPCMSNIIDQVVR